MNLLLLLACAGTEPVDSGVPVDTGDGGGDTGDGGGDTGDGGTVTEPEGSGEISRRGQATVLKDYQGVEELLFIADDGEGEELCRVELQLQSVASRTDCELCLWAWDLEIVDVRTKLDLECEAAGFGGAEDWQGEIVSVGYTDDYFGHAPAMLAWEHGAWQAVSYAWWDEETGEFLYQVMEGYAVY